MKRGRPCENNATGFKSRTSPIELRNQFVRFQVLHARGTTIVDQVKFRAEDCASTPSRLYPLLNRLGMQTVAMTTRTPRG